MIHFIHERVTGRRTHRLLKMAQFYLAGYDLRLGDTRLPSSKITEAQTGEAGTKLVALQQKMTTVDW